MKLLLNIHAHPTYRYGFNGMERDDEIKGKGNSYDFGARMYDSRLGRWFAVDPMAAAQPSQSTYKSFNNNPIIFVDPDGEVEYLVIKYTDKHGNTATIRKRLSYDIMTDGKFIRHKLFSFPVNEYAYKQNYYDFERVITINECEGGGYDFSESTNILTNGVVRDYDVALTFATGEKSGHVKDDWNTFDLTGDGFTQISGVNYTGDGTSPTKTRAKNNVESVNIESLLIALGQLGRVPGQLPKIKEGIGKAEFADVMSNLIQAVKSYTSSTTTSSTTSGDQPDSVKVSGEYRNQNTSANPFKYEGMKSTKTGETKIHKREIIEKK